MEWILDGYGEIDFFFISAMGCLTVGWVVLLDFRFRYINFRNYYLYKHVEFYCLEIIPECKI